MTFYSLEQQKKWCGGNADCEHVRWKRTKNDKKYLYCLRHKKPVFAVMNEYEFGETVPPIKDNYVDPDIHVPRPCFQPVYQVHFSVRQDENYPGKIILCGTTKQDVDSDDLHRTDDPRMVTCKRCKKKLKEMGVKHAGAYYDDLYEDPSIYRVAWDEENITKRREAVYVVKHDDGTVEYVSSLECEPEEYDRLQFAWRCRMCGRVYARHEGAKRCKHDETTDEMKEEFRYLRREEIVEMPYFNREGVD